MSPAAAVADNAVDDKDEGLPPQAKKLRAWIVGLTSVLVVVPAMINAGLDIVNTVMDHPRTEAEQINQTLYAKYFGQAPVFQGAVPVETAAGKVEMTLEVHSGGDIFVRYGELSQWFPSPATQAATAAQGFALMSQAVAADLPVQLPDNYQQHETRVNGSIVRELYLPDGTRQTYQIDTKTGRWSEPKLDTWQQVPEDARPVQRTTVFPVIDLTRPRTPQP